MASASEKYAELAAKVRAAVAAGHAAADATTSDGGSANLDHVVLCGLPGVREATLRNAGIDVYRHRDGFHFAYSFGGQGDRRYAGTQAMAASLKAAGVDCYVFYQMD